MLSKIFFLRGRRGVSRSRAVAAFGSALSLIFAFLTGVSPAANANTDAAMKLTGNPQYARNESFSVAPSSSFTVEIWFKRGSSELTDPNKILYFGDSNAGYYDRRLTLQHADSTTTDNTYSPRLEVFENNTKWLEGPNLAPGVWHHIAIVRSTSGAYLFYLDGDELTTSPGIAKTQTWTGLSLGKAPSSPTDSYYGLGEYDQFKFWNVALEKSQIQTSMYTYSTSSGTPGPSDLLLHYDFNGVTGSTVSNRGTAPINLTLYGSPTFTASEVPLTPTNTTLPVISGNLGVGKTLTTTNGTWSNGPTAFSYQWQGCDSSGNNCTVIAGATASTYTLASTDAGKTIRVVVTATNSSGSTTVTSSATGLIVDLPTNNAAPTITGTTTVDSTLTANAGTWTYTPTYTYQWQRCDSIGDNCVDISGEKGSTYKLTGPDYKNTVKVIVTATNAAGSASATSSASAEITSVPVISTSPVISGDAGVGKTLTTTNGTWSYDPTSFSYKWQRCDSAGQDCADISGATTSSYTLASADANKKIKVIVTAANATGSTTSTSNPTALIIDKPVNTAIPVISGDAGVGKILTANPGTWDNSPSFAYQWQRCESDGTGCTPIGTDSSTYVLVSADAGKKIRVAVTGSNVAGSTLAESALSDVIKNLPTNITLPTIAPETGSPAFLNGAVSSSAVLKATSGTWVDSVMRIFQWQRCDSSGANCADITSGGALSTYTLKAGDLGSKIRVAEKASNAAEGQSIAYSDAVLVVTTPVNSSPSITGTLAVGSSLTPSSNWSYSPTLTYKWQRCDANGANCVDIPGATSASYLISDADVGSTLRVVETAVNAAGTATETYPQTALITSAPLNTVLPLITGGTAVGQVLTASDGTWSFSPTSFAYQWQRCDASGANCTNISGATASAYTIVSADQGLRLKVLVTATNSTGDSVAESLATLIPAPAPNPGTQGSAGGGTINPVVMPQLSTPSVTSGPGSFSISWSITKAGTSDDSVIYTIQHSADFGITWAETSVTGSGLSRTVIELPTGVTYVFRVVATSGNNTYYSAVSRPITLKGSEVTAENTSKVTIGSFRGFLAIFTVGHLGSRLSVKLAGKWLVVDPLTNFRDHSFSRTLMKPALGGQVTVEVYINRKMVARKIILMR